MSEGIKVWEQADLLDFLDELEEKRGEGPLKRALAAVTQIVSDPDVSNESPAIAAVAIVAAWRGHPLVGSPEPLLKWVSRCRKPPSTELIDLALRALDQIAADSELADLYTEAGYRAAFNSFLAVARAALHADPIPLLKPARPRRFRPRLGDVLALPLPDGRCAFARTYPDDVLGVYRHIGATSGEPPIGLRDFWFFRMVSRFELEDGTAPEVVGRDPFAKGESRATPPTFFQQGADFIVWRDGVRHALTPTECRGMEQGDPWYLTTMISRIMLGDSHPEIARRVWPCYRHPQRGLIYVPWEQWPWSDAK